MNPNPAILDKIAKLLRLSRSSNQYEAALAAERAATLMAEHQIAEAQIAVDGEQESPLDIHHEPIVNLGSNFSTWKGILIRGVADSLGAQVYRNEFWVREKGKYNSNYTVMGTADMVAVASHLYAWLEGEINRLTEIEFQAQGDEDAPKAWRNSFRVGAASIIARRLRGRRPEALHKAATAAGPAGSQALVRIEHIEQAIKNTFDRFCTQQRNRKTHVSDQGAYRAGVLAGQNVDLDGGQRRLSMGSKA